MEQASQCETRLLKLDVFALLERGDHVSWLRDHDAGADGGDTTVDDRLEHLALAWLWASSERMEKQRVGKSEIPVRPIEVTAGMA